MCREDPVKELIREIAKKEGLELLDENAIYCHYDWTVNDCWSWVCCRICVSFAKANNNITEKKYEFKYKFYGEEYDVGVDIKKLKTIVMIKVTVYGYI